MKNLLVFVLLVPFGALAQEDIWSDILPPHMGILNKIEELSAEGSYGEIYDLLGSDYQSLTTRKTFVRISEEVKWELTESGFGTFTQHSGGRTADSTVRGVTKIGRMSHHIDTVAFFVKEDDEWRMWNFPFVRNNLLDRPGPILRLLTKEANQSPQRTATSGRP